MSSRLIEVTGYGDAERVYINVGQAESGRQIRGGPLEPGITIGVGNTAPESRFVSVSPAVTTTARRVSIRASDLWPQLRAASGGDVGRVMELAMLERGFRSDLPVQRMEYGDGDVIWFQDISPEISLTTCPDWPPAKTGDDVRCVR